jgi:hypothetical protein
MVLMHVDFAYFPVTDSFNFSVLSTFAQSNSYAFFALFSTMTGFSSNGAHHLEVTDETALFICVECVIKGITFKKHWQLLFFYNHCVRICTSTSATCGNVQNIYPQHMHAEKDCNHLYQTEFLYVVRPTSKKLFPPKL